MNQLEKIVNDLEQQIQSIEMEIEYKKGQKRQNLVQINELIQEKSHISDDVQKLQEDKKLFKHRFLKKTGNLLKIAIGMIVTLYATCYTSSLCGVVFWEEPGILSPIDMIKMLFSWGSLLPEQKYIALIIAGMVGATSWLWISPIVDFIKTNINERKTMKSYGSLESLEEDLDKKERRSLYVTELSETLTKDNKEIDEKISSLMIDKETLTKKLEIARSYLEAYELTCSAILNYDKGLNIDAIVRGLESKLSEVDSNSKEKAQKLQREL